jgi:hypothetical protein
LFEEEVKEQVDKKSVFHPILHDIFDLAFSQSIECRVPDTVAQEADG